MVLVEGSIVAIVLLASVDAKISGFKVLANEIALLLWVAFQIVSIHANGPVDAF